MSSSLTKRSASKVLAERAFWRFFDDEKPTFDGATIHPPMVYGPIVHQCDDPKKLNHSVGSECLFLLGAA
jgi:nucleoside-diphosphate-sugar epimerase